MRSRTTMRRRNVSIEPLEPRHLLTTLGPELVADLTQDPDSFVSTDVFSVGGTTLLVASSESTGSELYVSDGTSDGTQLWSDLNPGPGSSNPSNFHVSPDGSFSVFEGTLGDRRAIWYTRGQEAIPVMIQTLPTSLERVSILAISNSGAYLVRGTESNQAGISDYITDLWFVDNATGALQFVQTFTAEDEEGGIISAAVRDDGLLLFQHCLDEDYRCRVWGSDGSFLGTQVLLEEDFEDATVRQIDGDLYFADEDSKFFLYDGNALSVAPDDPTLREVTAANDAGVLAYVNGQLRFTDSATSTTEVVLDGLSLVPSLHATESRFMALVNRDGRNQLWGFDLSGQQSELLQDFDRDWGTVIATDSGSMYLNVTTPTWRSVTGGRFFPIAAAVWRTNGTPDGTIQLTSTVDGELDGALIGEELWLVRDSNGGRSLDVFRQDEVVSTIEDKWTATRGTSDFTLQPFGDQLVGHSNYEIWTAPLSLDEFTSISIDGFRIDDVFVVGDRIVYTAFGDAVRPGKAVYTNDGTFESNARLDEVFGELVNFSGGRSLGDRLVFQISNPPSLWSTDGTALGTAKIAELERAVSDSIWRESNGQLYVPSDHSLVDSDWLVTDGTAAGTRPVDVSEVPADTEGTYSINGIDYRYDVLAGVWVYSSSQVDSAVIGRDTYSLGSSLQVGHDVFFTSWLPGDSYGLFRITPGWDTPDSRNSPYIERYSELRLQGPTLEHVGDSLVVLYDDGFHGAEPWRIPITHNLEFGEDSVEVEITCDHASDLQSKIHFGESIPADTYLIWYDVNADFALNADDLAEWTRRVGAAGDVNVDGVVDAADLNQIGRHWGQQVRDGWCDGDLNGDGIVNAVDLNEVGQNWPSATAQPNAVARSPRSPLSHAARLAAVVEVGNAERETSVIAESRMVSAVVPTNTVALDRVLARQSYRREQVTAMPLPAQPSLESVDFVFRNLRENLLRRRVEATGR